MNNCDDGINYFMREESLENICNTYVDAVIQFNPYRQANSIAYPQDYPIFGINRSSTLVEDLCPCTCGKENSAIGNENVGKNESISTFMYLIYKEFHNFFKDIW